LSIVNYIISNRLCLVHGFNDTAFMMSNSVVFYERCIMNT